MEKQEFSFVRYISHLKPYILRNPIQYYVPHPPVKMMINELFQEGRWDKWLEKLQGGALASNASVVSRENPRDIIERALAISTLLLV